MQCRPLIESATQKAPAAAPEEQALSPQPTITKPLLSTGNIEKEVHLVMNPPTATFADPLTAEVEKAKEAAEPAPAPPTDTPESDQMLAQW